MTAFFGVAVGVGFGLFLSGYILGGGLIFALAAYALWNQ
jgi:hypothetical protein